jgi:hypothetical protein
VPGHFTNPSACCGLITSRIRPLQCPPIPPHNRNANAVSFVVAEEHHSIHHHHHPSSLIPHPTFQPHCKHPIMVLSSFNALNKIEAGDMRELNYCITSRLDSSTKADTEKPVGLHFLVEEKIFKGTNQRFLSCPIQFLLRSRSPETKLCQPVWTDASQRSVVNRKAKVGVCKHSVMIRADDFSVVLHKKAPSGYLFFLRSFVVSKKDVDDDAYERWL